MTILHDIVEDKWSSLRRKRRSLIEAVDREGISLIAELKRKSPSEGEIDLVDAVSTATIYETNGASAISVLTDKKYFGGSLEDLRAVKNAVDVPVLRKDFIVDEVQLYEAVVYGADAVLLISKILKEDTAKFVAKAHLSGLECLVEVHDEEDLKHAIASNAKLIGINNRDLETMKVDFKTTEELAPMVPEGKLVVSESGITCRKDIDRMRDAGADAVLVGSCLMKCSDKESKMRELVL